MALRLPKLNGQGGEAAAQRGEGERSVGAREDRPQGGV
jgi:hypothetical protein